MKLKIEESLAQEETEITIKCAYVDDTLKKLIEQIRSYSSSIIGNKHGNMHNISLNNIFYFESNEDQTFIYCNDNVYECEKKLYELESMLCNTSFIRISKSCIVNIDNLIHVHPLFDGKFEAVTLNGSVLIINRHYVKAFKAKFM